MARHMRGEQGDAAGQAGTGVPGASTDPSSPGYVDSALSARQRRKLQAREADGGGRGWTLLYLALAVALAAALWLLFSGPGIGA